MFVCVRARHFNKKNLLSEQFLHLYAYLILFPDIFTCLGAHNAFKILNNYLGGFITAVESLYNIIILAPDFSEVNSKLCS